MTIKLLREDVTEIKRRLWAGEDRRPLSVEFGISVGSVDQIKIGDRWAMVAWPDGSFGGMSETHRAELEKTRGSLSRRFRRTALIRGRQPAAPRPIDADSVPMAAEEEEKERAVEDYLVRHPSERTAFEFGLIKDADPVKAIDGYRLGKFLYTERENGDRRNVFELLREFDPAKIELSAELEKAYTKAKLAASIREQAEQSGFTGKRK